MLTSAEYFQWLVVGSAKSLLNFLKGSAEETVYKNIIITSQLILYQFSNARKHHTKVNHYWPMCLFGHQAAGNKNYVDYVHSEKIL